MARRGRVHPTNKRFTPPDIPEETSFEEIGDPDVEWDDPSPAPRTARDRRRGAQGHHSSHRGRDLGHQGPSRRRRHDRRYPDERALPPQHVYGRGNDRPEGRYYPRPPTGSRRRRDPYAGRDDARPGSRRSAPRTRSRYPRSPSSSRSSASRSRAYPVPTVNAPAVPAQTRGVRRPASEELDTPSRTPRPTGKTPFTNGTYLGLLGKVVYLIAIFLPWYLVTASVDAGDYSTNGWVDLVTIDGLKGVHINQLLTGGELPSLAKTLPVPLSWVLIFFFAWSVISIVRARTARRRGWKLVRGGLVILIVFGIIYLLVSRLPSMVPDDLADLREIAAYVAANPRGGEATRTFGIYGSVRLKWGLQMGGYMLLISAGMQLLGGFMEFGKD